MGTTENGTDGAVVKVSTHGQATIPVAFREKLGIEAPGRVRFVENDAGEVVLKRVPTAEEMRGFAAREADADEDRPASEILREKRAADTERRPDMDRRPETDDEE